MRGLILPSLQYYDPPPGWLVDVITGGGVDGCVVREVLVVVCGGGGCTVWSNTSKNAWTDIAHNLLQIVWTLSEKLTPTCSCVESENKFSHWGNSLEQYWVHHDPLQMLFSEHLLTCMPTELPPINRWSMIQLKTKALFKNENMRRNVKWRDKARDGTNRGREYYHIKICFSFLVLVCCSTRFEHFLPSESYISYQKNIPDPVLSYKLKWLAIT